MADVRIDLYSDTATQPTEAMRAYMCAAEVGDEQKGEDPSVNALQAMAAEMLGKEAAVFLPSGTMCNQIAFAVHCRRGDLVLLDRTAHPLISEAGAAAIIAGVTMYPIDGVRGQFTASQVAQTVEPASRYKPSFRVVSVEQTTNKPGGCIWPLEQVVEVCEVARSLGLVAHMDGARLFDASVAAGVAVEAYAGPFDSLWIDLSKGLGAPVGAVLLGSESFIEEAWQWKQRLGGAMRQAGIIAAAGIYALQNHVDRLEEDHRNARRLAERIEGAPGIAIDPEAVETNIVRFDVAGTKLDSATFASRLLEEEGVRVSTPAPSAVRAVPHLGISEADVDQGADAICALARRIAGEGK